MRNANISNVATKANSKNTPNENSGIEGEGSIVWLGECGKVEVETGLEVDVGAGVEIGEVDIGFINGWLSV